MKKKAKKTIKRNPYQKRKHTVKRKTRKIKKVHTELGKDGLPKRPRGRPRKDASIPTLNVTGKKRGRPRKMLSTEYKKEEPVIPTKPMKILKFAGYCPSCQLSLTTQDIVNEVFTCYKCNKSGNKTELLEKIERREPVKNKREYLQTVNSTTYDGGADSYHKPVKEAGEVEEKKDVETVEEVIDEEDTETTEPIDPIDPTEEIDLNDVEETPVIKTEEELAIEKKLKDFLDKDE